MIRTNGEVGIAADVQVLGQKQCLHSPTKVAGGTVPSAILVAMMLSIVCI